MKFSLAILLSVSILVTISACSTSGSRSVAKDEFSIYLADVDSCTGNGEKCNLNDLVLDQSPILSTEDIISYHWQNHEIYLTDEARDRIASLHVPTAGLPFVVCVGYERIYSGSFWVSWSSMSFEGVVIETTWLEAGSRKIRLQLGYPESPELFSGEDPRFDPRIKEALRKAEKLS